MSIRNFQNLLQKFVVRQPVQMPRFVPYRNFTTQNRDEQNKNQDISQSNVRKQMEQGSKNRDQDFPTKNTDTAQYKIEKEMKDQNAEFKDQQKTDQNKSDVDNSTRFGEAFLRQGENPSKADEQLDRQSQSGKKDTEQNKKWENVEFEKDSQDKGQKFGQDKQKKSEESSSKSFEKDNQSSKKSEHTEGASKQSKEQAQKHTKTGEQSKIY